MEFRNIAIIAHVDHGKTTLVDALLKQSGTFNEREVVQECVMDSNELERERGITIYAKNTAIVLDGIKINIVDTPGHADFGSEVERILRMVDSVLLLVDAFEGPMPQTKFVLRKSLALGLKPIVVINKIDKPMARPHEVLNMVFDLFVELGATNEQLDFQHIFTNGREGIAKRELTDESNDLRPLFDLILSSVPPAAHNTSVPMRMQPSNLAYDSYVGRLAVGRIYEGKLRTGMIVTVISPDGSRSNYKVTKLFNHQGLNKIEVTEAEAGDIIQIAGIPEIYVGDTIAEDPQAEPLPTIAIDPPTLKMDFAVNKSPFSGREGELITSRQIRDRLLKELEVNVGLKIEFSDAGDVFTISGRGEMHLSILIEQMRREGFELEVSQPKVIVKEKDGQTLEPIEIAVIDIPDAYVGSVIEKLGVRKGEMINMKSENGSTRLEYNIPTRSLLGYRSEFLTDTKGEGTFSHQFSDYAPWKGEINRRTTGSIISGFDGVTTAYALEGLQDRGPLFVDAGVEVYEGMVIGMSMKENITVNPIRGKKLTNMRSSGADMAIKLTPPMEMNLERALEYVDQDELVEVTPKSIRIRKRYLKEHERRRHQVM
ncbi:translational GTPase TypA [Candidatus Uhrbacteria bacterium CG_4_9_14_3_um_filter_36_7]|uniref:Large ribosomal subunit assembly factor BipA n=1 Tax=Candidatus Uhrbacteria bacterium CG_4_9_14_3_um_filter_36_7 TaxID=1975033 RepID=A0A2M7XHQ2_9BACT|nr:MAG: translational GTPase TypA [Candidatus Uhrbacteria bacterium CG_4_9_14_3_um_filter_36_7]